MRADRLLSIVWLLRAHGRMTTTQLAAELEVSRRTVLRDVEALSASGVPVYSERGPHGGIELLPGYQTDVSSLTSEESRALFAAMTTWGAESLGLGDALVSGLRKLLAAVPDAYRDQSVDVASRIVVDPQGWLPQPERDRLGSKFRGIRDAVFGQYCVRLEYRQKNESKVVSAIAQPHGFVSAGSSWYLCATMDDEIKFQKLSRVEEVHAIPEMPVRSRCRVNVAEEWAKHRTAFQQKFDPLRVDAWVRDSRWSDVHDWTIKATQVPANGSPPTNEDWSFFYLDFVDHLHALTILVRLGADAYIESPSSLRGDVVSFSARILDLYEGVSRGERASRYLPRNESLDINEQQPDKLSAS